MCDEQVQKKFKTNSPTPNSFHGLFQKLQNNDSDIRDYHFSIIRKANHKVTPNFITNPYPISLVYSGNTPTINPTIFSNNTTYIRRGYEHDFSPTLFVEHVIIASSVKYLPPNIFAKFYSLKTIMFEGTSTLTSIAQFAFINCIYLQQITIPPTVKFIGQRAFSDCFSLFKVEMQNCNIASVESCTFNGCVGLKTITLPDSILALKDCCFKEYCSLTNISLPPLLNYVGELAFIDCHALQFIYLPPFVEQARYAQKNHRNLWKFDFQTILIFERDFRTNLYGLDPYLSLQTISLIVERMQNNLDDEEKKNYLCLASMRQCCTRLPKVNGMNILHALCHFPSSCPGVLDTVDQLLHKCPEATQLIDNDGRTPLQYAVMFG